MQRALYQLNRYVRDASLALHADWESAFLEYVQHRDVSGKDFRNQLLDPGATGNGGQMMHECPAETLALILVDHGESHLRLPGLNDDVTCAAHDHGLAALVNDCNQRDVIDEIDMQEKLDFRLGKVALHRKEAPVKRLRAAARDGCDQAGPIVGF